ncbi:MAG: hypothetical protein JNK21_10015 [Rhodospirillaceae bacterium]|nr:hypothetical protein [Rhodospirillaceae bacterium]
MNVSLTKRPAPFDAGQTPASGNAKPSKPPFKFVLFIQQLIKRLRHWRNYVPPNAVTYDMAVKQFLGNVMGVTSRTYPAWLKVIEDALAEHNATDNRKADTEIAAHYPVDDFYFAGFVALEAAKIPGLYESAEVDTLFSVIADQLDVAANRNDRVVSDLFFEIIARLNLLHAEASQKQPYDKVVKVILKRLDFDKSDAGKLLLADKAFRQLLAEPFALYAPQWWEKFKAKFVLYQPRADEKNEEKDQEALAELIRVTEARRKEPKRRWRKRAGSLFDAA